MISFGSLSGRPLQVNPENLLFKQTIVKGFWAAKPSRIVTPEQIRGAIGDFVRRAAAGTLKLPIAEVFDLADAAKAASAHNEDGRPGKIALRGSAA